MGAKMTREEVAKSVWDLHFHEDPASRWRLCESLGEMPEFKEAFGRMAKVREGHVAAAVGLQDASKGAVRWKREAVIHIVSCAVS